MPSPLFSIWLTLLSPFFTASLLLFFHDWESEPFCVKCGLNADHFISLVRMRTNCGLLRKQCKRHKSYIGGFEKITVFVFFTQPHQFEFHRPPFATCHLLPHIVCCSKLPNNIGQPNSYILCPRKGPQIFSVSTKKDVENSCHSLVEVWAFWIH